MLLVRTNKTGMQLLVMKIYTCKRKCLTTRTTSKLSCLVLSSFVIVDESVQTHKCFVNMLIRYFVWTVVILRRFLTLAPPSSANTMALKEVGWHKAQHYWNNVSVSPSSIGIKFLPVFVCEQDKISTKAWLAAYIMKTAQSIFNTMMATKSSMSILHSSL